MADDRKRFSARKLASATRDPSRWQFLTALSATVIRGTLQQIAFCGLLDCVGLIQKPVTLHYHFDRLLAA